MKTRTSCLWAVLIATVAMANVRASDRIEIVWPTPNPAWAEGRPEREVLQQAGSGDPESGGFGGVRSGGSQFHEGLDLKPVARDRRGEPKDEVMAAMSGVVRHVSTSAGDSSYGRYIVIEHPEATPAVYTLYAHLARVAPGVRAGVTVERGQVIGVMGHSSGGYSIPRDRAHLHFEIGVMVTRDFQTWYDRKRFGSRNDHGLWNGMNLMGIDPWDFLEQWRTRRVNNFQEYFAQQPVAVRLRIATKRVPDFVARYPALVTKPMPADLGGWEIACNWTGLPMAWTPLTPMETIGLGTNVPTITAVDAALEKRERSKSLAVAWRGKWAPGRDLETMLEQVFALQKPN